MYSNEIEKILLKSNNIIHATLYKSIIDNSPQIKEIKYDSCNDTFQIWTHDGYHWVFHVCK